MSALFYLLALTAFSAAIADPELEALSAKIMELLNPHGADGKSNPALLSMTNGDQLSYDLLVGTNSSESIRVNVTFEGKIAISASRSAGKGPAKTVKISTQYGGGAVLAVNEADNVDTKFSEPAEIAEKPIDQHLEAIFEEHQKGQDDLVAGETSVLVAHGAGTGIKLRFDKRRAEAKVRGGFVVGAKTLVSSEFH